MFANWELTGFDKRLNELDLKIFHYGGNVYYIVTHYAIEKGYRVTKLRTGETHENLSS